MTQLPLAVKFPCDKTIMDECKEYIGSLSLGEKMNHLIIKDIQEDSSKDPLTSNAVHEGRKYELKTPKGTRDYGPEDMAIRERMFSVITNTYKRHGAVTIDTPVFELREVLMNKYGEDSKLIYDLSDQGGELCSLRYDLTVPFARYLAMTNKKHVKRYHIAKVYRRDNPSMSKGRLREFYQCDFDIAGAYDQPMLPDAECIRILVEVLTALNIGAFKVKVNHRQLLDGIFEISGVSESLFRSVCSAVDKLDKATWEEVYREMVLQKGLDSQIARRIGEFVLRKGTGTEMLAQLEQDASLMLNERARRGVQNLRMLFTFLDVLNVSEKVELNLSLARGLDYYTGLIFEAVAIQQETEMGSLAGGGRYDQLVGMFHSSGQDIPCVGFSVGVERVFALLQQTFASRKMQANGRETFVYVISLGDPDKMILERIQVARELWDEGLHTEYSYRHRIPFKTAVQECEKDRIPFAVIIGEEELAQGIVKLRYISTREERSVKRADMASSIRTWMKEMGMDTIREWMSEIALS